MILIADSGSTKTHWALLTPEGTQEAFTAGLNPRLSDAEAFDSAISQLRQALTQPFNQIEQLFFYGAGCGTIQMQNLVKERLASAFPTAAISVEGDLLGACRAACGKEAGLVGILGTGSNLCHYDGQHIDRQRPSTGYLLGDEGSGNHIGRRLLKDYLEERMPAAVSRLFEKAYPYPADHFLDQLYRQPNPNRYLASLTPFAARHRANPYIMQVIEACFASFFDLLDYFPPQQRGTLCLVGGLTATFGVELRALANRRGIDLGPLLADPMEGLIHYHSGQLQ